METAEKTLIFAGKLILFFFLAVIFIPSFLVVNYLQKTWTTMLSELFGL